MRLISIFILISFSGNSQNGTSVVITPTANVNMESSTSYIYCATIEIMWNELSNYLGEKPKSAIDNSTFTILNESNFKKYHPPIEDDYVVSQSGLVKDSIIQKINTELNRKFNTRWNPGPVNESALVSYSYLKKDVKFYYNLNDNFYDQPFNSTTNVDYFGVKEGDTSRSRKDIFVYDYRNPDDFIVQIKCRDSLDEIYFAKIPMESTLSISYQKVLERVNLNHMELFNGSDILKIPYLAFDTTTNYAMIEGATFKNKKLEGKAFQSVSQKISFDLNQQGIKLESSATSIIDYADFDNPPPRNLAFDKPFLIVMKRKNSDLPYFMYWVSGTEFMRSYQLKHRVIEDYESIVVGKWQYASKILWNGVEENKISENHFVEFYNDGTFIITGSYKVIEGEWKFNPSTKSIEISFLSSKSSSNIVVWKLDEINSEQFINGGKTKLIYKKVNTDNTH